MEIASPAFSVVISIMAAVIGLTGVGIYFSFGPGSKKLVDPWDHDDD
tara:strand:- start:956 stop:1096 length:141 start_codon:yes stop_codon:yes gene_type:complete